MRFADEKQAWRPSWGVTWAIVIAAVAFNAAGIYLGAMSWGTWGAGLLSGIALVTLGLRLEK